MRIICDTRLFGNIGEGAVAVVMIQNVAAPVADEQVVVSVVIVIADATTLPPTVAQQACLGSHVSECAIAIVTKQKGCGLATSLQGRSIHEEDVKPAIIVIVKQRDAATHLLEKISLRSGSPRDIYRSAETRAGCDIRERCSGT